MGGNQSQKAATVDIEGGKHVSQNKKKIDGLSRLMYAKADHQKVVAAKGWDKHDENMRNTQMLKGLFKQLDPTIMKVNNVVRGEIQLSFKYDFKRGLLLVKVIKCRELRSRDVRSRMPDPYVRLVSMPDVNEIGMKKTHVEKQTNNPRYDEIFALPLEELELVDVKLVIDVLDDDLMGQDDNLGQVIVELNTFNFKENPVHTAWYSLMEETDFGVTGELEVTLAYQLPHRLLVTVHKATGLPQRDDGRKADTFVKLHIPGTGTYHQTQTVYQSLEPEWEETFEFSVPQEEFRQRQLILHAIDEDKSSRNDSLGQVIIDLCNLDPERGLWDSYRLADLRLQKGTRNIVTQHRILEEFKQSLQAHVISKNPFLLYGPHTGKKVVSVSCRKAGAHARIRLVEGIPIK